MAKTVWSSTRIQTTSSTCGVRKCSRTPKRNCTIEEKRYAPPFLPRLWTCTSILLFCNIRIRYNCTNYFHTFFSRKYSYYTNMSRGAQYHDTMNIIVILYFFFNSFLLLNTTKLVLQILTIETVPLIIDRVWICRTVQRGKSIVWIFVVFFLPLPPSF